MKIKEKIKTNLRIKILKEMNKTKLQNISKCIKNEKQKQAITPSIIYQA